MLPNRRRTGNEWSGQQRWRIAEVEHEGAACRSRDEKPGDVGHHLLEDLGPTPRLLIEPDARVAVALPEALNGHHQVRPDGLPAQIPAPHATGDGGEQEERQRRHHQEAGDEVELLRPKLEPEEVEALVRHIDQECLVGDAWTAIPADPWQQIVDCHGDSHDHPLNVAEETRSTLGVDLLTARILTTGFLGVDGVDIMPLDTVRCFDNRMSAHSPLPRALGASAALLRARRKQSPQRLAQNASAIGRLSP